MAKSFANPVPGKKKDSIPTGRFVWCPASEHSHEPRLLPVVQGAKRCFYRCACGANGFMGRAWTGESMGFSFEQAQKLARERGAIVCGI
jgi:hypothetical protein